jgi:DNA-binding NarL/FixJ family response regulator
MTGSRGAARPIKVIVVNDPGGGRSLEVVLGRASELEVAGLAGDLRQALDAAGQFGANVVVVDAGPSTARALHAVESERLPCRLLVVARRAEDDLLIAAVQAGATGFVVGDRRDLDGEAPLQRELVDAIVAVDRGESVVPNRMLSGLLTDLIRRGHEWDRAVVRVGRLSGRQRAVLLLLGSGASLGVIARALDVSVYTVRSHIQEVLRKLGVHSRSEAVEWAVDSGVLDHLRRDAELVRATGGLG